MHTHIAAAAKSLQSCPTLRDPIDGLLPGSSVLLPAKTLPAAKSDIRSHRPIKRETGKCLALSGGLWLELIHMFPSMYIT